MLALCDVQAAGPARDAFLRQLLSRLVGSVRDALHGAETAAMYEKQAGGQWACYEPPCLAMLAKHAGAQPLTLAHVVILAHHTRCTYHTCPEERRLGRSS